MIKPPIPTPPHPDVLDQQSTLNHLRHRHTSARHVLCLRTTPLQHGVLPTSNHNQFNVPKDLLLWCTVLLSVLRVLHQTVQNLIGDHRLLLVLSQPRRIALLLKNIASTMTSDHSNRSNPKHGLCTQGSLRETLRRRRALRMAQICPVDLSLRPPRRHHHRADSNDVAVRRAVSDHLKWLTCTFDGRSPTDLTLAISVPQPPAILAELALLPQAAGVAGAAGVAAAAAAAVQVLTTATAITPVTGLSPEIHLLELLQKRGKLSSTTKVSSAEAGYDVPPTTKQIRDYDSKPFMTDLVRRGDVKALHLALEAGRGMDASNKFGESLVHVACRRGNIEVLRFLLRNGGSFTSCDDLGRTPLHEVCWAVEPRFDIVHLFLEQQHQQQGRQQQRAGEESAQTRSKTTRSTVGMIDVSAAEMSGSKSTRPISNVERKGSSMQQQQHQQPCLLLLSDKRGCTPLRYVKEQAWPLWRAFLDEVADEYWPPAVGMPRSGNDDDDNGDEDELHDDDDCDLEENNMDVVVVEAGGSNRGEASSSKLGG